MEVTWYATSHNRSDRQGLQVWQSGGRKFTPWGCASGGRGGAQAGRAPIALQGFVRSFVERRHGAGTEAAAAMMLDLVTGAAAPSACAVRNALVTAEMPFGQLCVFVCMLNDRACKAESSLIKLIHDC